MTSWQGIRDTRTVTFSATAFGRELIKSVIVCSLPRFSPCQTGISSFNIGILAGYRILYSADDGRELTGGGSCRSLPSLCGRECTKTRIMRCVTAICGTVRRLIWCLHTLPSPVAEQCQTARFSVLCHVSGYHDAQSCRCILCSRALIGWQTVENVRNP